MGVTFQNHLLLGKGYMMTKSISRISLFTEKQEHFLRIFTYVYLKKIQQCQPMEKSHGKFSFFWWKFR